MFCVMLLLSPWSVKCANAVPPETTSGLSSGPTKRTIQDGDRAVLGSGRADTGFVLVLPNGQPPNPDSITQRFRRDCASAGVAHITFHGLRHTFATLALVKGIALHVVSRCLGHSSEAITLAQYAHMLPGATVEAMQVAADFIFGDDPEQPDRPVS